MKLQIRKIYYWFYICWLASKWMFRVTLMDYVVWKGKKYIITNGVPRETWTIRNLEGAPDFKNIVLHKEVKKVWSIGGMIDSFRRGRRFYMYAWYKIWCYKGIEDWCRRCNIW